MPVSCPPLGLPPSPSRPLGFFWCTGTCTAQKYQGLNVPKCNPPPVRGGLPDYRGTVWRHINQFLSGPPAGSALVPHSGNLLASKPCTGFPPICLTFAMISFVLPGVTSQIIYLHTTSRLRLCFWLTPFHNCCDDFMENICVKQLLDPIVRTQ